MDTQSSHGLRILDLFRLSLRVFKTKPLRTFLTIMGMSFGIGTVLFLVSFGYGLQYILIGKLVATEDSLITIEALYPSETELNITYDDLKIISQMPETAEISPIAEFTGEIKINDQFGSLLIKIVKPNYFRLSGQIPDIGSSFSESEPAVIISSQAVKLTGTDQKTNQQIQESLYKEFSFKVFYQNEKNIEIEESATKEPLKLKGVFTDESQLPFAIIPEDFLTKEPPFFKRILVKAKDINSIEALRDKLLEKGFIISARIDLVKQATKVMRIITIVLGVFGVAALIVAAVGMFNTMVVSFLERTYEVGIIKSLGATDRDVKNLFLMESSVMGFLGGIGGIILGVGIGQIANFGLSLLATRLGGKPFELFITPLWFVGLILASSSLIGLISGFWPARRASFLSPKEAFVRK
ncbi:MAG: ABC transporter permease [Patescibacteria group bacterium]